MTAARRLAGGAAILPAAIAAAAVCLTACSTPVPLEAPETAAGAAQTQRPTSTPRTRLPAPASAARLPDAGPGARGSAAAPAAGPSAGAAAGAIAGTAAGAAAGSSAESSSRPADPPIAIERENARWLRATWADLPGWSADAPARAWPALLAGCARPAPGWAAACASARSLAQPDDARVRAWLERHLQPYRVTALDGTGEGLATGYFEPLVAAARRRSATHAVPLHALPAALATSTASGAGTRPWHTRAEIDALPAARAALQGREIAWLADPLDALLLQIQGSGRLAFDDDGDGDGDGRGAPSVVRVAYAGHNGQPYRSVGRWLVERGAFTLEQASWPAIKAWARANPQRVTEMLNANPRYVFFREEPLPDPAVGAVGAQGVPLTPGRSIAVDPRAVPYGTPVWLDTTEPEPWTPPPRPAPRPLRRLVLAQDTGSAITGAVRADYFWGWGDGVEERAGRMKQPLRMWALWPVK